MPTSFYIITLTALGLLLLLLALLGFGRTGGK